MNLFVNVKTFDYKMLFSVQSYMHFTTFFAKAKNDYGYSSDIVFISFNKRIYLRIYLNLFI